MDYFSQAFCDTRLRGSLLARLDLAAPFQVDFQQSVSGAPTHYLIEGDDVWLEQDGAPPLRLLPGDLVMFPHWDRHIIRVGQRTETILISELARGSGQEVWRPGQWLDAPLHLHHEGPGPPARFLSFVFELDETAPHPLFQALPPFIYLSREESRMTSWLQVVLDFLTSETGYDQPGYAAVSRRLAELLFIQIMRMQIINRPESVAGWLRALVDPAIGPTLAAIEANPGADWSVQRMAQHSALSRAVFCERFRHLAAMTPARYVRQARLNASTHMLAEGVRIKAIAETLGYATPYAFANAFRQRFGMTPSAYRKQVGAEGAGAFPAS